MAMAGINLCIHLGYHKNGGYHFSGLLRKPAAGRILRSMVGVDLVSILLRVDNDKIKNTFRIYSPLMLW